MTFLPKIRLICGASANNFLMQFQTDLVDRPLSRPKIRETTALGAAYLAGLATGYWTDLEDIKSHWAVEQTFTPSITQELRDEKVKGWHRAVKLSFDWARE